MTCRDVSLCRDDFDTFFAELYGDRWSPFRWQRRLLDSLLDGGWPEALVAPTGSGKTTAIDVHVFALAVASSTGKPLPPRRLAMIVNRRVLVDDQYRHARDLAHRLAKPDGAPVLTKVAELLWLLQGRFDVTADQGDDQRSPLLVARLRGGLPSSRRWADHPTAAAVLCATPDMFGSRLLFRGYGSSSRAWPREAGLLAVDTVALVDEAHLARQLVRTSRRIGELVPVAERKWDGPPALQVVETTATPDDTTGDQLGVTEGDLADSETLDARLRRPKPVSLVSVAGWAASTPRPYVAEELARRAVGLLDGRGGERRSVGCFVNTVARAVAVAAALRNTKITGRKLTVVLVCGQVRPIDIELLENDCPGLLSPRGNTDVDVIVSTQSLEVGVDIDLAGIVTELASGSALAQRAGRVNRRGEREAGPVVVIVPDEPLRDDARSGPYGADELLAAREWIENRAADPQGMAPWALRDDPAPAASPRRMLLQRPELGQVWHWARTSDDLAAEPELDLWLSDDLEPQSTVGIVVRQNLPDDVADTVELIKLLRPRAHETFSVPLKTARAALTDAASSAQPRAVVVRGDDVAPLDWTTTDTESRPRIRPGDLVVVDAAIPLFTASIHGDHRTPPVIATGNGVSRHPANDVLEATASLPRGPRPGEVVHRIDIAGDSTLADLLMIPDDETEAAPDERAVVRDWLDTHASGPMAAAAVELLRAEDRQVDVVVQHDPDNTPVRAVIIDGRRAVADEYVRQEWTPNPKPVRLAAHQNSVAERVAALAEQLALPADLTEALRQAALHHDDGKGDPRFQIHLGARGPALLAKSHDIPTPEKMRRRRARSGLPARWRHEQRSVVDAWPNIPKDLDRELVARLIGTTHGHGRSWFPHNSGELLNASDTTDTRDIAATLFDEGGWDELIEHTQQYYGVWGCAYLEAILRAADGQISAEGR